VIRALAIVVAAALLCACNDSREAPAVDKELAAQMEAVKNRKRYPVLTPAILASIPDAEVEQAVVDFVLAKIGEDYEHELEIVAKLPIGAQALYITWLVDAEVRNGGFDQYYANPSGKFADQAPEAFEFFSAREFAALMREANSVRALDAEKQRIERKSDAEAESRLGPLDKQFYALKEDLSALRIAKIRSMPQFFSGT
jgi:hypothetical protein